MQQSIVMVTKTQKLARRLLTLELSFHDLSLKLSLHNITRLEFLVPGFNKYFV